MELFIKDRKLFKLMCIIEEKKYTEHRMLKIKEEIDFHNDVSEKIQTLLEREQNTNRQEKLRNQIINCRAKVSCLTSIRRHLLKNLEITPPTKEKSGSLGYWAKKAQTELMEMSV